MGNPIEQFRHALLPFQSDWNSINIKIIAWQSQIGWIFHVFHAVLDTEKKSEPARNDLPEVENLLVVNAYWDMSKLEELITSFMKGEIRLKNNVIHIKQFDGIEWKPISLPSYSFYGKGDSERRFGIKYASLALQGYTSGKIDFNEKNLIEHRLRSGQIPWDGLEDLRRNFIKFGKDWASRDDSFLNIVAPLKISLKETKIIDNTINIVIKKAQSINYEKISLSIITYFSDGSLIRKKYPIKNDSIMINFELPITRAKVMVTYGDYIIDSKELYGKTDNKRILLYQHMMNSIQNLKTELQENGKMLESKVSLLFNLLGFSSAHYGFSSKEVPDIIAFSKDDKNILVIECSKREPDLGNKLTKLSTRTKEIKDIIGDVSILPVLITALERSLINKTDEEKAAKEVIAIISNDEIPTLINMALENKSTIEVFNFISGLIPFIHGAY